MFIRHALMRANNRKYIQYTINTENNLSKLIYSAAIPSVSK